MYNASAMNKREIEELILFSHEINRRLDDRESQKQVAEATVDNVLKKVEYIEEYSEI